MHKIMHIHRWWMRNLMWTVLVLLKQASGHLFKSILNCEWSSLYTLLNILNSLGKQPWVRKNAYYCMHTSDIWKCTINPGFTKHSSMWNQTCVCEPLPQTRPESVLGVDLNIQAKCENTLTGSAVTMLFLWFPKCTLKLFYSLHSFLLL